MLSEIAQILLAGMLALVPPGKNHNKHVVETWEEGVIRYSTIAQATAEVASELAWTGGVVDGQDCTWTGRKLPKGCSKLYSQRPWVGTEEELMSALLAVAWHESGFRKDVHTGIGSVSRGDCQWRDEVGKYAAPGAKGAHIVPGSCRSVCLAQINVGEGKTLVDGFTREELVGDDLDSTKRCLTAAARILSYSRNMCSRRQKADVSSMMFSAYGTGGTCYATDAKWVKEMANIASKFIGVAKRHPLEAKVKVLLGLEESESLSLR